MKLPDKPKDSSRLYSFDFKNRLRAGEAFASAGAPTVTGTVVASNPAFSGTKLFVRLSGGTVGEDCKVIISGVTNFGDTVAFPLLVSII